MMRTMVWLCLIGFGAIQVAQPSKPLPSLITSLKGYDPNSGQGRTVFEVPIEGTIDLGLAPFVERVAEQAGPTDIIFLRMNTFGGRVDGAVRIRDALLKTKATTVIFIEGRAISAGALIALSCDTILMSPGATIGDAMPIQMGAEGAEAKTSEKAISYMRAEMAATAKAKGRRGDLAEAMVDPDIEIKGVVAKGKLLTLTSDQAVSYKMADAVTTSFDEAVRLLNLTQATRVETNTKWSEKLARILTEPVVSSLLMTFGVLGLLIELYTPGFGLAGIVGIVCLATFFLGQYAAHLAGMEELLLLVGGLILLGIEILVLPGFGVVGILGIILTIAAMVMALVEVNIPWDVSMDLGYIREAISSAAVRISVLLMGVVVVTILFGKYFGKTRFGRRVILETATEAGKGFVSQSPTEAALLGKTGIAIGVLRPAGIAEINGKRVDVISEGEFIPAGTSIRVLQVDGNRVVVKKTDV